MSARIAEYGSWRSPITSRLLTRGSIYITEVRADILSGAVFWSELRYQDSGRYVVCSLGRQDPTPTDWTPAGFSARTRVHEYGGGAFLVHDGAVYFSNFADQRLYVQEKPDSTPKPLTPENVDWRFADGTLQNQLIYCIREDHSKEELSEAVNTVVCINLKNQQQKILPWNSTEIWVANLSADGQSVVEGSSQKLAGGNDISVMQPVWTLDDHLLFISDESNWWNLYEMENNGNTRNLLPRNLELGTAHWSFGNAAYASIQSDARKIATLYGGLLGVLDRKDGSYKPIETGFTSHSNLRVTNGEIVYCTAGSPTHCQSLIRVNLQTSQVEVLKMSEKITLDSGYLSVPEEVSWPTSNDDIAFGFFYPPTNKDYAAPAGTRPPLLVTVHGGPTSYSTNVLRLKKQYFTSKGFALLDVNYRGSTGYGKQYRHKLCGKWGIYDVDDCCTGAEFLARNGRVDGNKLCIDGGSAGGYTTLCCLSFKDVFKAGASHFGVSDIEVLAKDTHKFESRYFDYLVAPYTPENIQRYHELSPLYSIDKFNCPVAFFQGDEDKIVLPNQAEFMYEAIKKKNIPTAYILFEGEQHGFRKAENIQKALDGEFYFFSKVLGFKAADLEDVIPIVNLP